MDAEICCLIPSAPFRARPQRPGGFSWAPAAVFIDCLCCREPFTHDPATPRRLKSNQGSRWEPKGLQVGLFSQQRAILWAILISSPEAIGLIFPFLPPQQSGGYSLANILHRNAFSPSAPRRFPPVTSTLLQVATESMHSVCSFPNFHK